MVFQGIVDRDKMALVGLGALVSEALLEEGMTDFAGEELCL